jgi:DNA-binding SARP family transcriptional activator/tetratricopeptide (TPR) repeat protein
MKFAVLGQLLVTGPSGEPITLRGRNQSALLAMLLFHANELVAVDRLVEAVWDSAPPPSYLSNLHTYLTRLKKRLPDTEIDTIGRSYRLRVEPDDLDLRQFHDHASAGRHAMRDGDPATGAARLRAALALWRGRPLTGMSVLSLEPVIVQLAEKRVALLEDLMDCELGAGRHAAVVAELGGLVSEHPLRERLRIQLMTALHRAGRAAEALDAYRAARTIMIDELGLEPGTALRRAHAKLLRGEEPHDQGATTPMIRPGQLPPRIADFHGRADELRVLGELVQRGQSTAPVVVISGEPGVGKTALAMLTAHAVRDSFPDGQLFAQLAGGSASPRDPADVLGEFLRALGMASSAIPEQLTDRAAALRTRLADRRVLVVLDDAAEPEQVRPLLPGTAGCATLVTSRSRLSGLAGAHPLPLAPMDQRDAVGLLQTMLGAARVAAEPAAAARIIAACGGLPLALRVAGTRLALRSGSRLDSLADRLEIEQQRLDELAVSDLNVRASLASSYHSLTPLARSAFGLLGLLGPIDVAEWVIGVLAVTDDAGRVIEELLEASLLQQAGTDVTGEPRYRLHDLLRVYAREQVEAESAEHALHRLFAAYLGLADAASAGIQLMLTHRPADEAPEHGLPQQVARRLIADPVGWFDAERLNLLALVRSARPRDAVRLGHRLTQFLWMRGYWSEVHDLQQAALDHARASGDELAVAKAQCLLATLKFTKGEHGGLEDTYRATCAIFERLGDSVSLAYALGDYANLLATNGRLEESLACLQHAESLVDDAMAKTTLSSYVVVVLTLLRRFDQAAEVGARTLELARRFGAPRPLALLQLFLARLHLAGGRLAEARAASMEAEALLNDVGDQAEARSSVIRVRALAEAALGNRAVARELFQQGRTLAERLGLPFVQAMAARDLAACWISEGEYDRAVLTLRAAAERFRTIEQDSQLVIALRLQAIAEQGLGRRDAAAALHDEAGRLDHVSGDVIEAAALRVLLELAAPGTSLSGGDRLPV